MRLRGVLMMGALLAVGTALIASLLTPWKSNGPVPRRSVVSSLTFPSALFQALRLCGVSGKDQELIHLSERTSITLDDATALARRLGCAVEKLSSPEDWEPLRLPQPAVIGMNGGSYLVLAAVNVSTDQCLVFRDSQEFEWRNRMDLVREATELFAVRSDRSEPIGPVLWVSDFNVELGTLQQGRVHQQELAVINAGDAPLVIGDVMTSCGCTQAKMSKPVLDTGEAGRLLLAVDLHEQKAGRFDVSVMLKSNASTEPLTTLKLHAKVVATASLEPNHFGLGTVPPSERTRGLETTFRCTDCDGVTLEPVYLDSGLQWHSATLLDGGGAHLRLGVDFTAVQVDSQNRFTLHGFARETSKNKRVYEFVVTGIKQPWIEVIPATVFVGKLRPGDQRHMKAQLRAGVEGTAEVNSPLPEIVRARVTGPSILEFDVTAPNGNGFFRTTVLVRLGSHSINVPVTGIVDGNSDAVANIPVNSRGVSEESR